jgi:uncharacterized protein (DUF1697 family)
VSPEQNARLQIRPAGTHGSQALGQRQSHTLGWVKHWVALLRGVNVGGRTVKMAALREMLGDLGLTNVATVLQSGNVQFDASESAEKLKDRIEAGLGKRFGYDAHVQVMERERLRNVIDAYPFTTADGSQHDYVIFMERGLEKGLAAEEVDLGSGEKVEAGDGVVYWRVQKGSTLQSAFGKLLTKAKYRDLNTNRNLRTLRKLV